MSENQCKKHLWKEAFAERCISMSVPEHKDDVVVGLYCPKCFETKTLVYTINRERSSNEELNKLTYQKIEEHKQAQRKKENDKKMVQQITNNLSKLGYENEEILALLQVSQGQPLTVESLKAELKDEHKPMAQSIFTQVLN